MGKCFSKLDIAMFKIDDPCVLQTSQKLRIGVKVYFKHWDKCFLSLVEIPPEGIRIPRQSDKKSSTNKIDLKKIDDYSNKLKNETPNSHFTDEEGKELKDNPKESIEGTFPDLEIKEKSPLSESSGNSTIGTWGSTEEEINGIKSYKNLGYIMDSEEEISICSRISTQIEQSGNEISQIGTKNGSDIESHITYAEETHLHSRTKSKIHSQRAKVIAKVETYLNSQAGTKLVLRSHSESQVHSHVKQLKLKTETQVCYRNEVNFDSQLESGTTEGQFDLHTGSYFKNSTLLGDSSLGGRTETEVPAYENIHPNDRFSSMTAFHLNEMWKDDLKIVDCHQNNNQTISSRSSISEVELYFDGNTTPSYENIKENPNVTVSDELLTNVLTFIFNHFDFLIVILLCILLFLFLYILSNYK